MEFMITEGDRSGSSILTNKEKARNTLKAIITILTHMDSYWDIDTVHIKQLDLLRVKGGLTQLTERLENENEKKT